MHPRSGLNEVRRGRNGEAKLYPQRSARLIRAGINVLSKWVESPLFAGVGLSRTDADEQSFGGRAVGTDALLKLPGRPEAPCRSRVLQHLAQLSLLIPLGNSSPNHSHPPIDG